MFPSVATASGLGDAAAIPHVDGRAQEGYVNYSYAYEHKAFAIAPGGSWAWHSDASSATEAGELALTDCSQRTRQKCALYAIDDRVVFNAERWRGLWGPYLTAIEAAALPVGVEVGDRLYDLTYLDVRGGRRKLSDLKGKVVLVHLWGSWCPPCLRELPRLEKLQIELNNHTSSEVEMVLLQVRESFSLSNDWLQSNGLAGLSSYDSGVKGEGDETLSLADGSTITDRQLAAAFPSSYIIDGNGVILFKQRGPVADWLEFLPFLLHAAGY